MRIKAPPRITRDLQTSYVATLGSSFTLSVQATGSGLTYKWYKGNQVLRGETRSTLTFTNLNSSHGGSYKVEVNNDFGSVFSNVAQLRVGASPRITRDLQTSYVATLGSNLTLSVQATGSGLTYKWYKDNQVLSGETRSTLTLTNLNSSHGGSYKVEVNNDFGSVFFKWSTIESWSTS